MTLYNLLKKELESDTTFRERRFRGEKLARLALERYGLTDKYLAGRMDIKDMLDFAKSYDSFRHEYDAVQRDYPELQGKDYADGKILAQAKQIEFGYEPMFKKDLGMRSMFKL